jgi:hypothetical protein
MAKNSSSGLGCLIAFFGFGFFLLFINRSFISAPMFLMMFGGIFIFCIIISVANFKGKSETQRRKDLQSIDQNISQNPYILRTTHETNPERIVRKEEDIQNPPKILYCQFCGVRREEDAKYCHNCGTKLDFE